MRIKKSIISISLSLTLFANAEGSKAWPWNWGKNKDEQPTQSGSITKIKPQNTDLGRQPSRSKSTTRSGSNNAAAEKMVQERANKIASSRQSSLSADEKNLDLPDFFSQTGNPKIPTVKTADGTYLTENFFTGLSTHTISNDVAFRGFKLSDLIGDAPNLSTLQSAAHTGLISYFAEHPGLGGNPDRGYRPQFLPSFVRFVLESYPLMLESGELLYPNDRALQYIATGISPKQDERIDENLKIAFNEAQVAMADTDGNLLGPNMYPIFADAKVDAENKIFFTSDKWKEISTYSRGFESFLNQQVLMAFPVPDYSGAFRENINRRTAKEELHTLTPLSECYKLILKLRFKTARECFRQRKDEKMYAELTGAEDYSTLKDFRDAAFRGAVAGGVVTEISGAMDLGTGIGVGALANTLRLTYNKYLRKEDQFTQAQFDSLMSFINMYTFAPGPDAIIHPKKGMWKVYENGIILRYREEAVITGYKRDENGKRIANTGMRDIPIDLYGRDRSAEVGFRVVMNDKKNPDHGPVRAYGHLVDVRRSELRNAMKLASQLDTLSKSEEESGTPAKEAKKETLPIPPLPKISDETRSSLSEKSPPKGENE